MSVPSSELTPHAPPQASVSTPPPPSSWDQKEGGNEGAEEANSADKRKPGTLSTLCYKYSERGWLCTPLILNGLILPSRCNVRQKVAIAALCVLCGFSTNIQPPIPLPPPLPLLCFVSPECFALINKFFY